MGEFTGIEWTHHTFNPWIGCAKVSPACDHCYAEAGSRRLGAQHGLKLWQGDRYFTGLDYWKQPTRWNRAAEKAGERRRVFCASFADVFEDRRDLDARREMLAGLIAETPSLDWLLLTKRPEVAARLWSWMWPLGTPTNVWLGTTAEDQQRADERIPELLAVPAAVRFVSYEPALGRVDFRRIERAGRGPDIDALTGHVTRYGYKPRTPDECGIDVAVSRELPTLDWVIVGGESGPHARPFDVRWARDTVTACKAAGVACFVKQLGLRPVFTDDDRDLNVVEGYAMRLDAAGEEQHIPTQAEIEAGVVIPLHDKKGGDWDEWPEDLRVREFPGGSR